MRQRPIVLKGEIRVQGQTLWIQLLHLVFWAIACLALTFAILWSMWTCMQVLGAIGGP